MDHRSTRYVPALLDEGLYHSDGQIQGEVYVLGSFLQSAMYASGVACSDCHDPHSARLRASGNALCSTCHVAEAYDAPATTTMSRAPPGQRACRATCRNRRTWAWIPGGITACGCQGLT